MTTPPVLTDSEAFRAALAAAVSDLGIEQPVVGLVPTMGALHSGHAALVDAARAESDLVIVSIFVNPLQFNDAADYAAYPRSTADDVALLAAHGVDLVFAPDVKHMYPGYPDGPLIRVSAGELGRRWEGASRPGHFDGVVTVVAKLFSIMAPPAPARLQAWFGEKDAEQVAIVSRLTRDLSLPAEIRALPTVRDDGGLALSSRNQRLTEAQLDDARAISRTLSALRSRAREGLPLELDRLRAELAAAPGVELDYLVLVDPSTLREVSPHGVLTAEGVFRGVPGSVPGGDSGGAPGGGALALAAAQVGPVRLIDNMLIPAAADTAA